MSTKYPELISWYTVKNNIVTLRVACRTWQAANIVLNRVQIMPSETNTPYDSETILAFHIVDSRREPNGAYSAIS